MFFSLFVVYLATLSVILSVKYQVINLLSLTVSLRTTRFKTQKFYMTLALL
jgi:hypothetical protein